jgi:hypothetical protein
MYKNMSAHELISGRKHPLLNKITHVQHNGLMDEFRAAERFGYTPYVDHQPGGWFEVPRKTRAALTAYVSLDGLERAIIEHDAAEKARKEAESKRKR